MHTEPRVVSFVRQENIDAVLYIPCEIELKIPVNFETNAVFKLVSTAFNSRAYRITAGLNDWKITVKVVFTHPGKGQVINIVPVSNCTVGKDSSISVDVYGVQRDFNKLTGVYDYDEIDVYDKRKSLGGFVGVDYYDDVNVLGEQVDKGTGDYDGNKTGIPCNLSSLIITCSKIGQKAKSFIFEKVVKDKHWAIDIKNLSRLKETLAHGLLYELSLYNSAYFAFDFNKIPFKKYELACALKDGEIEWEKKQKKKRMEFMDVEECTKRKDHLISLDGGSIIQVTSGTREEKSPDHLVEISVSPQDGYFCKSHPLISIRKINAEGLLGQPAQFINKARFNVYQYYSFTDTDEADPNTSENKAVEQIVRKLKEFKNKQKIHNVYAVEISSCGFPNVIENLTEKPLSSLTSNIHVYPSDEYAFFFESSSKDKVNIKTAMYDRKKTRFYIEDKHLAVLGEKKPENIRASDVIIHPENYSIYPNISVSNLSKASKGNNTVRAEKSFNSIDDCYQSFQGEALVEVDATNAVLYRNGRDFSNFGKYNTFAKYVSSLKQKLQTAFLNLISVCYSRDYSLDFSIDVMNGAFLEKWGIKEYLDNTVFHWKKIFSNMDIFRYCFESKFASFWGNGENLFKGAVSISATGALTHIDDYEKTILDSSYRYYKKKSKSSVDICLYPVLSDDNAISAGVVKKHGIEGELERSFQIEENGGELEYNVRFPGIAAEVEHKVPVFKTSVYEKPFVREYIGGTLVEKSMFPCFNFAPWISLQSGYEGVYGKLFKLSNMVKEAIFYLYRAQNQLLNNRLWCKENSVSELRALAAWKANLKRPEFDVNGMLVRAPLSEEDSGTISIENKQWCMFLDGVNGNAINNMPSSPLLKEVYQYLKTREGSLIPENYENLGVGQNIFNFVLIVMAITNFLEAKQVKLLDMMSKLELDYKNLVELFNGEKLKGVAVSYDEIEKVATAKFDALCKELNISEAKNAFSQVEIGDIKELLSKLSFANNIDFGNLEKFCGSISFVSELLENCVNSRSYWLTGINRPMKVKPIFKQ